MLSVGYEFLTLLRGRVLRYTFKCYVCHSMDIIKKSIVFQLQLDPADRWPATGRPEQGDYARDCPSISGHNLLEKKEEKCTLNGHNRPFFLHKESVNK